jgi:membrane protein
MGFFASVPRALGRALGRAREAHVSRLAASIGFFAIFSLPALLLAAIQVAGSVYGAEAARARLVEQASRHVGEGLAATLDAVIAGAVASGATRPGPQVVSWVALVFGASLTFVELQHGLNVIWGTPPPRRWVLGVVLKRALSFAMVLVAGTVLMATMAVSLGLAHLGGWLVERLPPALALDVLRWIEPAASLALLTLLFVLLFKLLPDGRVPWRRASMAALATALLLLGARLVVTRVLAATDVASVYGAAGSLAILLVWVYACAVVVLLGGVLAAAWDETRAGTAPVAPADPELRA